MKFLSMRSWSPWVVGAAIGGADRNHPEQTIRWRVHRGRVADDRSTARRRLHERARNQRRSSTRRFELGVPDHDLYLWCECCDGLIREARRFPCLSLFPTCSWVC